MAGGGSTDISGFSALVTLRDFAGLIAVTVRRYRRTGANWTVYEQPSQLARTTHHDALCAERWCIPAAAAPVWMVSAHPLL